MRGGYKLHRHVFMMEYSTQVSIYSEFVVPTTMLYGVRIIGWRFGPKFV